MASEEIGVPEEIEGIGTDEDASFGEYPIDTLLIRHETRTVHDIMRRISNGTYILNPDFQRDFVWQVDKQSKLIESVLLRIPLPVFYLAEDSEGRLIVVDGLQRLTTFKHYVDGQFALRLPEQPELDKKKFEALSPKLQNRIEDFQLILYIIDSKVHEKARLDIFERVNSGVPLTRQQMRNSLYMGQATRFLKEESSSEVFKTATGGSLRTDTMRDREFVNRFCAFYLLGPEEYRGDMDNFLAAALKRMNSVSEAYLEDLADALGNGLFNNHVLFEKHAFRKHTSQSSSRSPINASLFDVMSTILADVDTKMVVDRAPKIRTCFDRLMGNPEFIQSITYSVNDTKRVMTRFELAQAEFAEVLNA